MQPDLCEASDLTSEGQVYFCYIFLAQSQNFVSSAMIDLDLCSLTSVYPLLHTYFQTMGQKFGIPELAT